MKVENKNLILMESIALKLILFLKKCTLGGGGGRRRFNFSAVGLSLCGTRTGETQDDEA
jgi:hypothetical protein